MTTDWIPQYTHQDIEILEELKVYSGYLVVKHLKIQFRLFGGGFSHPVYREVLFKHPAVAVLLYDPDSGQVVMIEQVRLGAMEDPNSPWILELVAGIIDEGEEANMTAHRETVEETGCSLLSLIPICVCLPTPGISTERTTIYCGRVVAPNSGSLQGLVEEGEDIKVHVLKKEEAFRLLAEGKIISAPTIIALQWLQLNHASLRFPQ